MTAFPDDGAGTDLAHLVEVLGPSVLRVLATPGLHGVPVRQVVVHDVGEPPTLRLGDVLLGVGLVATSDDACRVVRTAGAAGVAAVVVRSRATDLPQLRAAALEQGVTLLVLPAAMPWEHSSVLMRHAIATGGSAASSDVGTGDLFGFANVVARAVGGPVTVEDARSHVLAYSTLEVGELDEPRREAILGRQVPPAYLQHLHEHGIFRALAASDDVVTVAAEERFGLRRRLAVAVRAGGELLGSLWVQEGRTELGPGAEQALVEAARVAPGHLLRAQTMGLTLRHRREDLLAGLLEGRADPAVAAEALGFDATLPCAVVGIALAGPLPLGHDRPAVRHLDDLLGTRAMAYRWLVASVPVGTRLLVLVPELTGPREAVEAGIERLAQSFAADAEQAGLPALVACGPVVARLADASRATRTVDAMLQLLADDPARGPVVSYRRARAAVTTGAVVDALDDIDVLFDGPVARLLEHDERNGTDYHLTLRAWLDAGGDTARVARSLHVHPNTVRYRVQRLVEVCGIDLDDPDERLVAALHLRHVARAARRPTSAGAADR